MIDWDGPAEGQVPEKYRPFADETLRMWARWRSDQFNHTEAAAELGCTVEELRREVATGFTAPLEQRVAALEAELAQHQPEERVGECGCGDWQWGVLLYEDQLCPSFSRDGCPEPCPEMAEGATCSACGKDGPRPQWYFAASPSWSVEAWGRGPRRCNECDWELDQQTGIARRNADSARVQRVREALDRYLPGAIRERWMSLGGFVPQSVEDALPTICQTADTIRAALDGEDNEEVTA